MECTIFPGPVVVRALSERQAREIAVRCLRTPKPKKCQTIRCPWGYSRLSKCEELPESHFDVDGPERLLAPPHHHLEKTCD